MNNETYGFKIEIKTDDAVESIENLTNALNKLLKSVEKIPSEKLKNKVLASISELIKLKN